MARQTDPSPDKWEQLRDDMTAAETETRSPENPTFDLNDPAQWEAMWGGSHKSDTGITVNQQTALQFAPVLQAVSMISGDVAKLSLECWKRKGDRERVIDREHPSHKMVSRQANEETSALKFWRRFMVHLLLWGNAYAFIDHSVDGQPLGMLNLLPDRTAPERAMVHGKARLIYNTEVATDSGPKMVTLDPREVFHVESVTLDNMASVNITQQMKNAWGLGLALEKFKARFFREGARVGGVLEIPNTFTREAATNLQEGFTAKHTGPDNWFRIAILRDGAKFHSTTVAPQEGQLGEAGTEQVRQVARSFMLKPSQLGVDGDSYGSKAEDNQSYLDQTLAIHLASITDECWSKLLTKEQRDADSHFFEHDTSKLLRLNPLAQAQVDAIYIRNTVDSPNDVRFKRGDNPRVGGDEYGTPGAPSPQKLGGDNDEDKDNDGDKEGKTPSEDGKTDEEKQRHEFTRAVFNVCQRARHKAERGANAFIEFIDGGLKNHTGDQSADFVSPIVKAFRACDTATADELAGRVDHVATQLELNYVTEYLKGNPWQV